MDLQDTALPVADSSAEAGGQTSALPEDQQQEQTEQPKAEKTPEQLEIDRLARELKKEQRRIGNLTRAKYELQAQLQSRDVSSTHQPRQEQTAGTQADDEPLQLSRAELQKLIDQEARKLAPTITQQQAEIERRHKTVEALAQTWGQEKFDDLARDLDDAFHGLQDQQGRPKPATDAIFESENPRELIEYLADPDNAAEAEALARLSPIQAGRAIARLEAKLSAKKATEQPQPSSAPKPLETDRGRGGNVQRDPADMTDAEFAAWRRKQIAARK